MLDYGALNDISAQILRDTDTTNNGPDAQDPQLVADAVADLIVQPQGTRPLRTVLGISTFGLTTLNAAKAQVQRTLLDTWRLTEALAFTISNEDTTER